MWSLLLIASAEAECWDDDAGRCKTSAPKSSKGWSYVGGKEYFCMKADRTNLFLSKFQCAHLDKVLEVYEPASIFSIEARNDFGIPRNTTQCRWNGGLRCSLWDKNCCAAADKWCKLRGSKDKPCKKKFQL